MRSRTTEGRPCPASARRIGEVGMSRRCHSALRPLPGSLNLQSGPARWAIRPLHRIHALEGSPPRQGTAPRSSRMAVMRRAQYRGARSGYEANFQNTSHRKAHSADARFATALARLHGDAVERCNRRHGFRLEPRSDMEAGSLLTAEERAFRMAVLKRRFATWPGWRDISRDPTSRPLAGARRKSRVSESRAVRPGVFGSSVRVTVTLRTPRHRERAPRCTSCESLQVPLRASRVRSLD